MRVNVFWVPGPWPGKLGIVPRPRGGDWLEDEAKAWHQAGIDVVVSLLEPEEEAQLLLRGEAAAAAAGGLKFNTFPIPDRGVPDSRESVAKLASGIVQALEKGKNVAIHCRQGIGRSALIVGAIIVAAGNQPDTALEIIKRSRGLEVPETDEQRKWLQNFSSWLLAANATTPAASADRLGRLRR